MSWKDDLEALGIEELRKVTDLLIEKWLGHHTEEAKQAMIASYILKIRETEALKLQPVTTTEEE